MIVIFLVMLQRVENPTTTTVEYTDQEIEFFGKLKAEGFNSLD